MNPNAFAHRKSALRLHLTKPGGKALSPEEATPVLNDFETSSSYEILVDGFRGDYEISCRDIRASFSLDGQHLELQPGLS